MSRWPIYSQLGSESVNWALFPHSSILNAERNIYIDLSTYWVLRHHRSGKSRVVWNRNWELLWRDLTPNPEQTFPLASSSLVYKTKKSEVCASGIPFAYLGIINKYREIFWKECPLVCADAFYVCLTLDTPFSKPIMFSITFIGEKEFNMNIYGYTVGS